MTDGRWSNNRRHENRRAAVGRVSWGGHHQISRNVGLLSDESVSGISFVTNRNNEPCCGDQVWLARTRNREQFQVMRVTEYGDNASLVGCRRV